MIAYCINRSFYSHYYFLIICLIVDLSIVNIVVFTIHLFFGKLSSIIYSLEPVSSIPSGNSSIATTSWIVSTDLSSNSSSPIQEFVGELFSLDRTNFFPVSL
jgi:hypothetical protein